MSPIAPAPDPRRWKALALLAVSNFMVILDAQIVLLALPSIETDLAMSPRQSPWVMSAYLLAFGGLLLLGGRAGDLMGRRRMFLAGTAVFLLASLLCGLAVTGPMLIAMRVVQGLSAALMAPSALSILLSTFTGAERAKALAVWSSTGGFGATAALLLGGVITSGLGWSWVFLLNIPVAAAMMAAAPKLLVESRDHGQQRAFDTTGAVTITAALALLVYAIVEAPAQGWLSATTLGLVAAAAVLLAVFVRVERRSIAPLVPLPILRNRPLVVGNSLFTVMAALANGMSLLVSLYAQQVLGFGPALFGLTTAVMPVMAVVGAMTTQHVLPRVGVRVAGTTGMVLLAGALMLFSRVDPAGSYAVELLPALVIFGLGLGVCSVSAPVVALGNVADSEFGLASGINNAAFQIGGALGVALVSTVALGALDQANTPQAMTDALAAGFLALAVAATAGTVLALLLQLPAPETSADASRTATSPSRLERHREDDLGAGSTASTRASR